MSSPNIIVYMTDQQRADTIYPVARSITKNISEFAKKSVVFQNAYCTSPHCCPSRASFFSGLYPTQHGVFNNVDVGNRLSATLYDGVRLFSEDLKEAGYNMYYSGKWHVSKYESPLDRGFDYCFPYNEEYYKKPDKNYPKADNYEWHHYYQNIEQSEKWFNSKGNSPDGQRYGGQLIRNGYPTYSLFGEINEKISDENTINTAIKYINEGASSNKPFFACVCPTQPHDPYIVPDRFLNLYNIEDIDLPNSFYDSLSDKPNLYKRTRERFSQMSENEYKDCIRHYLALCSYQDELFGKIIKSVIDNGIYENTIIIYLSDHGDYCGDHGLFSKGLPCFNGAYNIPMIIGGGYLEKLTQAKIVDDFTVLTDIAPTILELAGVKSNIKFEGNSLTDYIYCDFTIPKRTEVYTQSNGNELYGIQRSVRTNKWKYVYNGFDYDELYDLENDPNELINLARLNEYKKTVKDLMCKIWTFAYKNDDTCINPYIMVSLAPFGPGIIF